MAHHLPSEKGAETVTTETQEIQDQTSNAGTSNALTGEVITTAEGSADVKQQMLKANEQIIKRNWQKAQEKVQTVYRALTIIHTHDLWKLHKDDKGKRKYTAFDQYLFGEFGWELSRVRALQIIKATRQQMIEAGELPAGTGETRKRTAPEITTEKAAKVTADQLQKALEAFTNRINSIDEGDPDRAEIVNLYGETKDALDPIIADLREIVARAEAEATPKGEFPLSESDLETDDDDEPEDDDSQDQDDDESEDDAE